MKTIAEVLQLSTRFLQEKNIPRARFYAEELLSFVLKKKRMDLYLDFERPLEENELELMRQLIKRKAKHEPTEYILGQVEFYQCNIMVSQDVLIPRPETEILLDYVVKDLLNQDLTGKVAWDICCGSGCLGIGLKKKIPALAVSLSDLSKEALTIAKKNAHLQKLSVEFLEGDLLDPFQGKVADIILCNPPYISKKEYEALDLSVKNFEPKLALVAGETGLEFYERLSKELPSYLEKRAKIYLEIGFNQGPKLLDLFNSPVWRRKEIKKDWSGHDRFFFLEIE